MMNVATQIAVALLGCWEPVTGGRFGEVTCVSMGAEPTELRITTIVPGSPVTQQVLRLDGSRQPVTLDGCEGWESTEPSRDGQRIVIAAEVRCGAGPRQRRSGAFTITPSGEWLHAEGRGVATISDVQLRLLRPAVAYGGVPQEVREALSEVMEEAVVARGVLARAHLTASDLVELDEMALDTKVIDVVVAAGHPESFVIGVGGRPAAVAEGDEGPRHRMYAMYPMFGFGYPAFYYDDLAYRYGCSNLYGGYFFTSYGDRRFCSAYSYWAYDAWRRGGYYGWTGGYPYGPVVITPNQPSGAGGRVVRGQGYTRPGTTAGTRTAEPRSAGSAGRSSTTSRSSGGSSSAGSGSRSGTGSTSSSSGGGTRTAQPRKP